MTPPLEHTALQLIAALANSLWLEPNECGHPAEGGNEMKASRTATCTQDQTRLARNNAMNDRLHLFRSKRNHTPSPCHSLSMFFLTSRDLELKKFKKSVFSSGIHATPSYSCHWLSMPSGAVVVRSIQGLAAWQPSASSHGLERVERRVPCIDDMSWNVMECLSLVLTFNRFNMYCCIKIIAVLVITVLTIHCWGTAAIQFLPIPTVEPQCLFASKQRS